MEGLPLILVVEDDQDIQSMVASTLSKGGSEPAVASSGEEAMTFLKRPSTEICSLVTDVKLPGRIDGWEVARIARQIDPALPIIYISGARAHRWASLGVPRSILVAKPFAPAQILTAVSQLSGLRKQRRGTGMPGLSSSCSG